MKMPSLIDKAFLLKKTVLFGSLDLDLLLAIADKATVSAFGAGEEIFAPSQEGSRMYIIVEGKVQITDRDRRPSIQLTRGDFFGDEAVFNDKPRSYYALSASKTQLLALSRTHLMTIISECPSVAIALLQVYASPMTFRTREGMS